jgi:pyrimidine nucleoside transport protein
VAWGFLIQGILGIIILRWEFGARKFHEASDAIVAFIDFTNQGTAFVYGFIANPPHICGMSPVFAFTVIPVITHEERKNSPKEKSRANTNADFMHS